MKTLVQDSCIFNPYTTLKYLFLLSFTAYEVAIFSALVCSHYSCEQRGAGPSNEDTRCSPLSDLVCREVKHGHSVVGDRVWPWSSPGQ